MRSKFSNIALAVGVSLALAFTFGCAGSNDDNGDDGGGNNNSTSNNNNSGGGSGNTQANAKLVTVGYSASHTISSSGKHWFKFIGTGDPVIFETTGDVVDTYITLTAENSYIGWTNDNGGEGSNALISQNTTSGTTYFIQIEPRSGTSGTYTFVVTAPTSNIRTNPISVMEGYSSSNIINSNGQHWFRFQGTGSNVIFETEGNVVNTDMSLFIGDNTSAILTDKKRISFSTVSGTAYYIKITGNSGTYIFNVRNGIGDGSSQSYAIPVSVGYSALHTISSSGKHWFSFLGTGESVTFKTTGDVVDTYITLTAVNSYIGWTNDNGGEGSNALISQNTTSGTTYFIQIEPRSGTSGTYTFVVE